MQALVDGTDIENDDVTIIVVGEFGGEAHRGKSLIAAVDTCQNAEAIAPLPPQVLQGLLHRRFLAVRKGRALEQSEHNPLCVQPPHRAIRGQ